MLVILHNLALCVLPSPGLCCAVWFVLVSARRCSQAGVLYVCHLMLLAQGMPSLGCTSAQCPLVKHLMLEQGIV